MKTATKKIIVAAIAFGFLLGMSSCDKHTCPTYSKTELKQGGAKA